MRRICNTFLAATAMLLLEAIPAPAIAQTDNTVPEYLQDIIPPTPDAAALARYGEIPVSMALGVPEISFPIYEIAGNGITLPVSLSYHASGIKVDDIPTTVGLGWSLMAGGTITRSVNGIPDRHDMGSRSYYDYETLRAELQDAQLTGNRGIVDNILLQGSHGDYDTEGDSFSYNVCGHSGTFRYSYSDNSYVSLDDPTLKIHATISSDPKEIDGFTLTLGNGTVCHFDTYEYVGPADDEGRTIISSWLLTEICTPSDTITLNYAAGIPFNTYGYSETLTAGIRRFYDDPDHKWRMTINKNGHGSTYVNNPMLISSISWKEGTISFTYSDDRQDLCPQRLSQITVSGGNRTVKTVTLGNNSYFADSNHNIHSRMKLSTLTDSTTGTYSFTYNEGVSLPPLMTQQTHSRSCKTDYYGYYNGKSSNLYATKNFVDYVASQYDGTMVWENNPATIRSLAADRRPDINYTTAAILTGIQYPTGGRTLFEYEANGGGDFACGVRVRSITDDDGVSSSTRRFSYTLYTTTVTNPEDYMRWKSHTIYTATEANMPGGYLSDDLNCSSSPMLSACQANFSRYYNTITETYADGTSTEYHYTEPWLDNTVSSSYDPSWKHPLYSTSQRIDAGNIQPLMSSKTVRDAYGNGVMSESYDYDEYIIRHIPMGTRMLSVVSSIQGGMPFDTMYYGPDYVLIDSVYAWQRAVLPTSRTNSDLTSGYSVTETYTYDPQMRTLQPRETRVVNSDGVTHTVKNYYPFDYNASSTGAERTWHDMAEYNILDIPVKKEEKYGSTVMSTVLTEYQFDSASDWFYPYRVRKAVGTGQYWDACKYQAYSNGRPTDILINGTDRYRMTWDGYGNLTSLKVGDGASSLTTSYGNAPLLGQTSVTTPFGYTTNYSYDAAGRLSSISDYSGQIQTFEYGYANNYNAVTNGGNMVRSNRILSPSGYDRTSSTSYFDGLGRPVLKSVLGANTQGNYVYSLTTYDSRGREMYSWLPVAGSNYEQPSTYMSSSGYGSSAQAQYSDSYAYLQHSYDAAGRRISDSTPGYAWVGKQRSTEYVTNSGSDVRRYSSSSATSSAVTSNGYYGAGTLEGEKVTDEDGLTIVTYRDRIGRTVLERRYGRNGADRTDTYYVYNALGQLRFVLQPEYQSSSDVSRYAFEYRYDSHGRISGKKLPGCEMTEYWYIGDTDRLAYEQDATLRSANKYRYFCYDTAGNLTGQGVSSSMSSYGGTFEVENTYTNGLLSQSRRTTSSGGTILDVMVNDNKGRVTSKTTTYPDGSRRTTDMVYEYWGDLRSEVTEDYNSSNSRLLRQERTITYDAGSGLPSYTDLKVTTPGSTMTKRISSVQYDNLGRTASETSGSLGLTTAYTYDLHGWLTQLSCPAAGFSEWLYYADGAGTHCYNGNISAIQWQTAHDSARHGYLFSYDGQGRMKNAIYGAGTDYSVNQNRYTEKVTSYTANGNIRYLERYGKRDSGSYGMIDNLYCYYDGNKLFNVYDAASRLHYYGSFDYQDGYESDDSDEQEMAYNGEGALIWDKDKDITSITYDILNNMKRVTFGNGNYTQYDYDANGTKLSVTYNSQVEAMAPGGGTLRRTSTTRYRGNVIMESGRISKCLFNGGYVSFSTLGVPTFYFYVKDHLGNVREVVTEDGTDVQVTHYYPFGGVIGDISTGPAVQRFKYNGKEFDRENGLDWLDYGARPYAPDVPRFLKQDMMAEAVYNQSSYMYANSNPVYYIDLFGLKGVSPEDAEEGWHSFDTINDWIELPNVTITASAENNDWGIDSTASKWTPGLPSTGDFLSVSGWANSLGEFVFNKKTTAQKSKIVYDTKKAIKKKTGIAIRVSNSELYRTVIPNTFVKIGKKLTNASFIATMVENGYDISNNNCVSYGNIIDCTMAGMPYIPIVGPSIAVTYVGLDIVLTLSTGKGNRYYINQWYNNTIGTSSIYDF